MSAHEANKKEDYYFSQLPPAAVYDALKTQPEGLSEPEVLLRRKVYGFNELPDALQKSWYRIFLKQFKSLMVLVLVLAALLSYVTHQYVDVYIILIVILIDAIIGFVQEWKAEGALASLRKMLSPTAKVMRSGILKQINSIELVPGDLLVVEEGDTISADARLVEARSLRLNESSLTGESLPENKIAAALPAGASMADQTNIIHKGTFVIGGYGKAIVISIGMNTELGKVAKSLQSIIPEKSHFQKKVDTLASQMGLASLVAAILFFAIGYVTLELPFHELLLIAVAAMVSIIPEGLPSIIVIVLAIGAKRMTAKKAIVREFTTTETLGAVTTIITDKTGTLTENALTARILYLVDEEDIHISGEGWSPLGDFKQGQQTIDFQESKSPLLQAISIAAEAINASVRYKEETKSYELIGDPTEGALCVLAQKSGWVRNTFKRLDDLPFDSTNKFRATLIDKEGQRELFVIGAPEKILMHTTQVLTSKGVFALSEAQRETIQQKISAFTALSMRVIALAYRVCPEQESIEKEDVKELIFTGLVGMLDPPREEVKGAVQECKKAGIRIIMATGDHASTAVAIARLVGIVEEKDDAKPVVLTEDQLLVLNESEFDRAIETVHVFARLSPQTKLKIASRLQALGHLIAMTGDGVNDAPAIKKADVGIAMGIMGTDVARDAAKLVLADDNFATIVHAIEEGRIVFNNARQASFYLITTNLAEITTLIAAISLGLPMPLTAIQILWLNLVTDGIGDMAIATERGQPGVMDEPPLKREERLLSKSIIPFLVINVLLMSVLSLAAYHYYLPVSLETGRSAVFIIMSFTQLFNMYNMRSLKKSVFEIGFFSNRFVSLAMITSVITTVAILEVEIFHPYFGFATIPLVDFIVMIGLSSSVFWISEVYKYVIKSKY